jgi:hypothetical protein
MASQPLGTGFTYQGRLTDNGAPANGLYDLGFVLHDDPVNPGYLGNSIIQFAVPITNGLFTVQLNTAGEFGTNAFVGNARWLEVDVRTNGGPLINNFTVLSPRQFLAPAPQAMFAATAASASTADVASIALNANSANSAAVANSIAWSNISGIPAGFADGVDNDTHYFAGPGLALGATNQFSVNFAGSGVAATAARSDHDHFGAAWTGTSSGFGLVVHNSSTTGTGIYGAQGTGSGASVPIGYRAALWGEASQGDAIYGATGSTSGTGVYGYAAAASGTTFGVYGQSDSPGGAGVLARGSGTTGTALRISNGAIRVTGAGLASSTPAFVHVITASNTDTNGYYSVINNPYCNNDPNAILFIMPLEFVGTNYFFSPNVSLAYDTGDNGIATNRWVISADGANNFWAGQRFNVLVIKP